MRCVHEASLYDQNSFITLTYAKEIKQDWCSLDYRDVQLWLKRLRKSEPNKKIRFYMCGEYGENFGRPHYHVILFNHDFNDKYPIRLLERNSNHKIYRSPKLEELWPHGFSSIGAVTFESAAYVARYCMPKVTGKMTMDDFGDTYWSSDRDHYLVVDPETGEMFHRVPEFNKMSLKPGIGHTWLSRFTSDVYPDGSCVVRGKECKPPRYYDKSYFKENPEMEKPIKERRKLEGEKQRWNNTDDRLAVREQVSLARLNSLRKEI